MVSRNLGRLIRIATAVLLLVTAGVPILDVAAATDLYAGAPAIVARPGGPTAPIRIAPDTFAVDIAHVENGIPATVLDGPLAAADGSLWYHVDIGGIVGFIAASDLGWGPAQPVAPPAPVEPAPLIVTGTALLVSPDGSEIACRAEPRYDAEWIFSYANGSLADLAGPPVDGWQPVVCAVRLGYVPANHVYDPAAVPPPAETAVPTEVLEPPVLDEAPIEETPLPIVETSTTADPIADPTEPATAEPTESPVTDTVVPQDPEPTAPEPTQPVEPTRVSSETDPAPTEPTPIATESVGQTVTEDEALVVSASVASSAVVSGTGAGGLRCRGGATLDSPVLLVLPLGASVAVTGPASNGWQPVICEGQNGFVAARFLQPVSGAPNAEDAVEAAAALTGATGVVQNTGGLGVRCRTDASLTASIITVLSEGTTVSSRGAAVGIWQPVTCAGMAGWIHTDFLANTGAGGSNPNPPSSTTGSATVTGTDGAGVRFRASAGFDGAVIAVLSEGTSVSLRSGSVGSWTAVTYGGRDGFVYADYLTTARNPSPGTGSGVGGTSLAPGSNARVNDVLNFRSGASFSASVLGIAPVGTVVRITGAINGGFYPVQWGGVAGFMHGDYLSFTTQPLSSTGPNSGTGGNTGGGPGAGSGAGTASGQALVDFAMRYLGYPYVWATHGPNSFDCSGFTYWVVLNVLGRNIGAGTWTQWGTGTPIQYGNLQPGDLVFFQNTYTVGLSHVGMYIGGDQFIHAENETTGVRISSLSSQYYSTRYLGARRMT